MVLKNCRATLLLAIAMVAAVAAAMLHAEEPKGVLRAGIIGLDTSHVIAFTQALNDPAAPPEFAGVKVVAAFPGGSPDNPLSADRIAQFSDGVRKMHVELVDNIDELLKKVDVVLLESVDGRPHLQQARPVLVAGKRLFIDKPMAASLADAMRIFALAEKYHTPVFSASGARFDRDLQSIRNGRSPTGQAKDYFGDVTRCVTWSPMVIMAHHPDMFFYGIHGVEVMFTLMGPGCKTVVRAGPQTVVGFWADGRDATYVARSEIGAEVFGAKRSGPAGRKEGYAPEIAAICAFFKTGKPPVEAKETLEILAFMEAADESKRQGGAPVSIESIMAKARKQVQATEGR